MKNFFLFSGFIIFLFFSESAGLKAQFNRFGGGLTFNSTMGNSNLDIGNPGFNFRGVYEISNKFFVIPSLTVQIPKKKTYQEGYDKTTYLGNLDLNITYTLATEKQLLFYALGAVNFTNVYQSWKPSHPEIENKYEFCPGLVIGTGIEMIVEKDINAFSQIEYIVGKYQQLVIFIGVHYYFKGRRYRTW